MKITVWRVLAFFLLIALSIGFGFGWDAVATAIERHKYPIDKDLANAITQNAELYGIPEPILWATVQTGSQFASNAVSESGEIGLTQITPARFEWICINLLDGEAKDAGMLYDPATNLTAGCAYLSYLYDRYGVWDHVFAAYRTDTDTVDAWLATPGWVSEQGVLTNIPDASVADFVDTVKTAVDFYSKLYYET